MTPSQGTQQSPTNINHIQDMMLNLVYCFCSIVVMPVEMALRPQYGSRYFPPLIMFFTACMMTILPLFFSVASVVVHMVPLIRIPPTFGMIGMWGFSKLFFLGAMVHGVRIWRRMLNPLREANSTFEGPALPFFSLLPGASFWRVRIVYEPAFVFALSIFLPNFLILEPGAATFLTISAFLLAMKEYCAWYCQWQFLRELLDMRNAGPIIAKLIENQASDDDLATVHLASVPKDMPEDLRRSFASHIARVFSPDGEAPASNNSKEATHEHHTPTT